jgi:hypothetical protein
MHPNTHHLYNYYTMEMNQMKLLADIYDNSCTTFVDPLLLGICAIYQYHTIAYGVPHHISHIAPEHKYQKMEASH